MVPGPLLACMAAVSTFYHLPPQALPAIYAVENGRAGVVRHNTNGTDDLGVMQINTLWVPVLSRATRVPVTRVHHSLVHDECFNIAVSGAILRIYLHESGDLVTAIGYYHSHTPALREAYQLRVLAQTPLSDKPHTPP
jgi:hypothetical protein